MKPLEKRKTIFEQEAEDKRIELNEQAGHERYDASLMWYFLNHWTAHNSPIRANTLMLWEKVKRDNKGIFDMGKRLGTFFKRQQEWGKNKQFMTASKKTKFPNYLDRGLIRRLPPQEYQEYKKHLGKLGYKFTWSPTGGSTVREPSGNTVSL